MDENPRAWYPGLIFSSPTRSESGKTMPNDPLFHIVLEGSINRDDDPDHAARRLSELFKIDLSTAARLLSNRRTIIKKNLHRAAGEGFCQVLADAGFRCRMEPVSGGPEQPSGKECARFECPRCGHVCGLDGRYVTGDICPACSVVVAKYLKRERFETPGKAGNPPPPENGGQPEGTESGDRIFPAWVITVFKWGLTVLGGWLLIQTGISVFDINNFEILYSSQSTDKICIGDPREKYHPELRQYMMEMDGQIDFEGERPCIKSLKLHILNSGRKTQPQTVVRLRMTPDIQSALIDDPQFLDFDRAQRQGVRVRVREDVTSYAIGPLKPADQVFVRMKLIVNQSDDIAWTDILDKIDIAKGEIHETDSPRLTLMTRILLSLFGAFDTSPREAAEELSDIFLENADQEGEALTREFDMADADLTVDIETSGVPMFDMQSSPITYMATIRVFNNGPGDAADVKLTYQLPESATVVTISMTIEGHQERLYEILKESRKRYRPGDLPTGCSETDSGVTCAIQILRPKKAAYLHLTIRDTDPGADSFYAEAQSARPDADDADNAVTYRLEAPEPME